MSTKPGHHSLICCRRSPAVELGFCRASMSARSTIAIGKQPLEGWQQLAAVWDGTREKHISHARSNAATLAPFKQLPLEEMWAQMKEGTEEKVFTGSTPGPTRFFSCCGCHRREAVCPTLAQKLAQAEKQTVMCSSCICCSVGRFGGFRARNDSVKSLPAWLL